jgi:hypothetical protein
MDNCPAEDIYEMVGVQSNFFRGDRTNVDAICRLNTKIESRGLEVKDLTKDLSDGVSGFPVA